MAYYTNSTDAQHFYEQCEKCILSKEPCPIFLTQTEFNYDACNEELPTKILNTLVTNEEGCKMFLLLVEAIPSCETCVNYKVTHGIKYDLEGDEVKYTTYNCFYGFDIDKINMCKKYERK